MNSKNIMRTLRIETPSFPGNLGKVATAIGLAGGDVVDSLEELMETCDIVIATTGVPGLIQENWVRQGQVILALSNPKPEIEPEAALQAGAAYAADGRSVNNVLGFPGIFFAVP
ncbi:hypothetical protein GCM10020331_096410 [Ectobacillus funiculus]